MKRIIYTIAAALMLLSGCSILVDEMEKSNRSLEQRIELNELRIAELERSIDSINSNIASLQKLMAALQSEDRVISTKPLYNLPDSSVIGYEMVFCLSGTITLYNGTDGKTPVIGVCKDSLGVYCWTLNGEWLTDADGNRIKSEGQDGVTPRLRINEKIWEVSYDNGASWQSLGVKAVAEDASICFSSITKEDDGVKFTMVDGTSFTIPFYKRLGVTFNFDGDTAGIAAGSTIEVGYKLTNADEGTNVIVNTDGCFKAKVARNSTDEGSIIITCPDVFQEGFINVIVTDSKGYSTVRVINFEENRLEFTDGLEYSAPASITTLNIPFKANFDYNIVIPEEYSSWIQLSPNTRAKSMESHTIVLVIDGNRSDGERTGIVEIYDVNCSSSPIETITINQAGVYFSIKQTNFAFEEEGGSFTVNAVSHEGIQFEIDKTIDWCTATSISLGSFNHKIQITASANETGKKRNAVITIYNNDHSILLGTLKVCQKGSSLGDAGDLVLTVRANAVNNYTTYLPLAGTVDCLVEWGDGSFDNYLTTGVSDDNTETRYSHKYADGEVRNYTVHITGTAAELRADENNVPYQSVTAVKQWGDLSIVSMENAFLSDTMLESVVGDTLAAFKGVKSFKNAFAGCINLAKVESTIFSKATEATSFAGTFNGCAALTSIPEDIFAYNVKAKDFSRCFSNTGIMIIPEVLFDSCKEATAFAETFLGCTKLSAMPKGLFEKNIHATDFEGTFRNCGKSLCGETPYSEILGVKVHLYERGKYPDNFATPTSFANCFAGDTSISDYTSVPSEWK